MRVILVLISCLFALPSHAECLGSYDRSQYPTWGPSEEYADIRQEVIAHAVVSGLVVEGGRVVAGTWYDKMTGKLYDIKEVTPDVDHVASLGWIHARGGACMTRHLRRKVANDKSHLWAVHPTANRRKGKKVANFLPPNFGVCMDYLSTLKSVSEKYQLNIPRWERSRFNKLMALCRKYEKGVIIKTKWWETIF